MKIKFATFLLLFISATFPSTGQESPLPEKLKNAADDTAKVNLLCKTSEELRNSDPEAALNYADRALQLAEQLNYRQGLINAYNNLGIANGQLGDFSLAMECFQKTIELRNEAGDTLENHKAYNNIGLILKLKGDINNALYYLRKSLDLRKILGDSLQIATSLNNIATIMMSQGKYSAALDKLYDALRVQEKLKNKAGISDACNNIGDVLLRQEKYDQALQYLFRSLSLDKEMGNKRNMAITYTNIGRIYSKNAEFDRALEYEFLALKIQKELKDEKRMAVTYLEIGELLLKEGDLDRATEYVLKAKEFFSNNEMKLDEAQVYIDLAHIEQERKSWDQVLKFAEQALEIGRLNHYTPVMREAYLAISNAHEMLGHYRESLIDYKLYAGLKDSIHNQQVEEKIAALQMKYRDAQREKQIQLLKKDRQVKDIKLRKNQTLGYFLAGGLSLVIILALFIFRAYRLKKRAHELLSMKNMEVMEQKEIIEEKNKNITDSIEYAKRIQDAILPSDDEISDLLEDHFIFFKPKAIVSGDFYWFQQCGSKLIMTVADCTGHGVPGAFMSMIGNTLLNEIIVEMGVEEPDKILNHLRDGIINALKQKGGEDEARDGMDIALMALDKENYTLEYAGAHNPLYHITQGRLTVLPADKQPVGYQKGVEKPFTKHTIKVQPGDVLYVFSDGYIDQFGGTEERKFKADRLRKILLNCWDEPMREQQKILESAFEQWKGDLEQVDDICVLGIRV